MLGGMPYERLRRGRWSESTRVYLVTTATHERRPLFGEFAIASIVAREIRAADVAGHWRGIAWVVMPDHVHLLLELREAPLPRAVGWFKGRTSRLIGLRRLASGPIWQDGFHDHAVRCQEDIRALARYVCANPVRDGIVTTLRDYPFWDACWMGERRQAEA